MKLSKRIVFRLDIDTAHKLRELSLQSNLQQTKLIKQWLRASLNHDYSTVYNSLKLNRTITLYISNDLITEIDTRANLIGVKRSSYIYNVIYKQLNFNQITYKDTISDAKFEDLFTKGLYKQLFELVGYKLELLNTSQLIDFTIALVLTGNNNKAKEVIILITDRLDLESKNPSLNYFKNHGKFLILQSRLARAIDSAYKSGLYAKEALNIGLSLKDSDITVQALLRLTASYLGGDDFYNAMDCINKIKKIISTPMARNWVQTYTLESYIHLYQLNFKKVLECINKAKIILDKNPNYFQKAELLYIELRTKYLLNTTQNDWMMIFSELTRLININGSEFLKIASYNTSAAFFIKQNKEDLALQYAQKALDIEQSHFIYTYNKSSFSNIMLMYMASKNNLDYFINTINSFINARKQMKDDYISYEYLKSSAMLFYSYNKKDKFTAIKTLNSLKTNKENPIIAYAANESLVNRSQLFIR